MGDFEDHGRRGDEGGYVVGNTAKQQMAVAKYTKSHVKKLVGTNEKIPIVNSVKTIETTLKDRSILLKTVASIATDTTGTSVTTPSLWSHTTVQRGNQF